MKMKIKNQKKKEKYDEVESSGNDVAYISLFFLIYMGFKEKIENHRKRYTKKKKITKLNFGRN